MQQAFATLQKQNCNLAKDLVTAAECIAGNWELMQWYLILASHKISYKDHILWINIEMIVMQL